MKTTTATMMMTTLDTLPGELTILGLVVGFSSALKPLHLTMQGQVQDQLTDAQSHMEKMAREMGANAVVGVRMAYNTFGALVLTGTAVRLTK